MWLAKMILVRENRPCKVCERTTEHWKLVARLGGVSKAMTYTGGVGIPLMQRLTGKLTPWNCPVCNPLRPGVKVKGTYGGRGLPKKTVEKLLRDGFA